MNLATRRTKCSIVQTLLHRVRRRWLHPLLAALVVAAVAGCSSDQLSPLDSVHRGAVPVVLTNMPDLPNPAADSIIELILAHYDEPSKTRLRQLLNDKRAFVELLDRPELKALLDDLQIARRRQPDFGRVGSLPRDR